MSPWPAWRRPLLSSSSTRGGQRHDNLVRWRQVACPQSRLAPGAWQRRRRLAPGLAAPPRPPATSLPVRLLNQLRYQDCVVGALGQGLSSHDQRHAEFLVCSRRQPQQLLRGAAMDTPQHACQHAQLRCRQRGPQRPGSLNHHRHGVQYRRQLADGGVGSRMLAQVSGCHGCQQPGVSPGAGDSRQVRAAAPRAVCSTNVSSDHF